MAYIRDLVMHDQQAEFRSDVQLSHYDHPKTNLGLLQSFIFSYNAPRGMVSAVDVLETLRGVFTVARQENRIVCIANYGHGKSHLALVLANYFAKPYGSPELEKVLEKVSKAVDNQTKVQRLREFRQEQGEFLVVRLRGDENIGLREQFMNQIQVALQEHQATKNERLSFWSEKALQLLENLPEEQKEKAERFLETMETDLAGLRGDVRNRLDQGYDRTRLLFKHLNGYLPDLGGEVSLQKLLKQVANDYCGERKPFAGIVILFDEFSLFVQRYAQRRSAGELQELLVGIEELGNKAVFLAFSQHDPITVAKNYSSSHEQSESLERELTRIPRKVILYSLLESVIDAYLNQPAEAWREFASDRQVRGPLARASNVAMELFRRRYEEDLRWGPEKFDEVVTYGAFPLHPLTTALLCNLSFAGAETIGNPRTLLGFIREQVTLRQDQPVLNDGMINWVLPIFLVDYFKEYLGKDPFRLYESALNKLPENAPPEQERLLKALLLQNVAELRLNRDNQESFLEEAAGVPHGQTKIHLTALVSSQCIRMDESKRTYAFWSLSTDPDALKKKLQKKLEGKGLTRELLDKLSEEQVKAVPVAVRWGHEEDWEAKEVLLTRQYFTVERLQELFPRFHISKYGTLEDGARGGVVWLVPETSEDVTWFQQHAEEVINQAFPEDYPLPVIVKTTSRTYPRLFKAYQTLKALEAMSEPERKETGLELYEYEKRQQEAVIRQDMVMLRGEPHNFANMPHKAINYILPAAYRPAVRLSREPSVKQVLEECYRLAYTFSPPEFYTQYKNPARGANNLWKATKLLSTLLMRNSLGAGQISLRSDKIAQDILQKFLYTKWKIVADDNRICETDNGNVTRAWTVLEEAFKPGIRNLYVRDALIRLLNPPYGYDYNTLALLFSAWIGYHQHDLQFTTMSRQISIDGLMSILNEAAGRQTFIGEICGAQKVTISRRDSGELVREVNQLIERVNKETFGQAQAEDVSAKLQVHCKDAGLPEEICTAAQHAVERLAVGLETARVYDQNAKAIQNELENGRDIQTFIQLIKRISDLPRTGLVTPNQKSIVELDTIWREGLQRKVDAECNRLVKVNRLQEVGVNQMNLENLKKLLTTAKLEKQAERVQEALSEIARREKELEKEREGVEKEAPVQAEIQAMSRRMPIMTLYANIKRLEEIQGYSQITLNLRDQRRREITNEIEQLEKIARGLKEGVSEIDTLQVAQEWQTTYLRNLDRFEGSHFQAELETAQDQVQQIQSFLTELRDIEQRPMRNLQEVAETVQFLDALQTKTQTWLIGKPLQRLSQAQQRAKRYGQQKSEEAHQWLERVQTLYSQGEPIHRVVRELDVEQPYLLPNDQNLLEQLKQNVKRKQEEDVITRIEVEFRQIADPALRQACVKRLQSILYEAQETSSAY
ncbi:hypothetical protein [Levilinea saccharolytica]|uniref:Uncharacterized protein n=2 Tax=Levilinea saccharolytica TaxID=229921 RepID=A0A0P6X243_9CHLR|nr:hypothetical protein [Levilinea saccharolytica]KPL76598.1 hypothetical protein ADN01_16615 [Levilinea saccharolytica]GAP17319.1 hypothetical protein LSAC_01188 [Levilinea saccharolytica]